MKVKTNHLGIKRLLALTGVVGLSAGLSFSLMRSSSDRAKASDELNIPARNIVSKPPKQIVPVIKIAYRNDTLYHSTSTVAFFENKHKSITRNWVEKDSHFNLRMTVMAHEDWHHHNDDLKYRTHSKLSPYEYYKLCMHDEISANIVSLLVARYEYLAATDKDKVLKKYKNSMFSAYFQAIKDGTIVPESRDKTELEKEFRLIANTVPQAWIERALAAYTPATKRMMLRYIKRVGMRQENRKQYLKYCNEMYSIGGVNFFALMEHDIDPSNSVTDLVTEMKNVKAFKKNAEQITNYAINGYELLDKEDISQQNSAFCHIFMAAKLKTELKKLDGYSLEYNRKAVSAIYHKVFYELAKDPDFQKMVVHFYMPDINRFTLIPNAEPVPSSQFLAKIYTDRGVNLTELINNFRPEEIPFSQSFTQLSLHRIQALDYDENDIIAEAPLSDFRVQENAPATSRRKRISGVLYMEIPNFRNDILIDASKDDEAAIFKAINDFENIPAVLKSCDTEAIEQYWAKNKKTSR